MRTFWEHQERNETVMVQKGRRVIFEVIAADVGLMLCLPKWVSFYEGKGWER